MLDWRLPFRRWRLTHHALLAALALLCVAALGGWLLQRATRTLATLQVQQQTLNQALQSGANLAQNGPGGDFVGQLPSRLRTDELSRDIGAFAQVAGVDISALVLDTRDASSHELGRVQFNVTAQAEYKATKAWLAELLARYPALGVQSLALNAPPNESTRQEVRLVLVWYVKD